MMVRMLQKENKEACGGDDWWHGGKVFIGKPKTLSLVSLVSRAPAVRCSWVAFLLLPQWALEAVRG